MRRVYHLSLVRSTPSSVLCAARLVAMEVATRLVQSTRQAGEIDSHVCIVWTLPGLWRTTTKPNEAQTLLFCSVKVDVHGSKCRF